MNTVTILNADLNNQNKSDIENYFNFRNIKPQNYQNAYLDTLHIGIVIGGKSSMNEAEYLIKSILLFTNIGVNTIEFNIITANGSQILIHNLFKNKIYSPIINITYCCVDIQLNESLLINYAKDINYDINYHHTKIYGITKLFFHEFFPHLQSQKVMILDIDMIIFNNLVLLWKEAFLNNNNNNNKAIWYFAKEQSNALNTGVFLCDYNRLYNFFDLHNNQIKFQKYLRNGLKRAKIQSCKVKSNLYQCAWGEQSILNGLYKLYPELFGSFDTSWNLGSCVNFNGVLRKNTYYEKLLDSDKQLAPFILHYNCGFGEDGSAFNGRQNIFIQFIREYKWKWFNSGNAKVTQMTLNIKEKHKNQDPS